MSGLSKSRRVRSVRYALHKSETGQEWAGGMPSTRTRNSDGPGDGPGDDRPARSPLRIARSRPMAMMLAIAATPLLLASSVLAQSNAPPAGWAPVAPNSSAVSRATESNTAQVTLSLSAVLTEDGQAIDQGVVWHVFRERPGADGKRPLVSQHKEALPRLRLEPGDYMINAAFGRATLTRKVTVAAGKPMVEKFNLNAGGLRIKAVLASGEPAPDRSVVFDVLNEERDQAGNRIMVISAARPGLIMRLNAGVYQVVSTYGDANAKVRAEVTVEPGKLTEAALSHTGTKVTFKLVGREGGEALADVSWSIVDTKAETVKEAVGALPTHILAAGRYAVLAKHQGRTFRAEFTAKAGESAVVEVVAR